MFPGRLGGDHPRVSGAGSLYVWETTRVIFSGPDAELPLDKGEVVEELLERMPLGFKVSSLYRVEFRDESRDVGPVRPGGIAVAGSRLVGTSPLATAAQLVLWLVAILVSTVSIVGIAPPSITSSGLRLVGCVDAPEPDGDLPLLLPVTDGGLLFFGDTLLEDDNVERV